LRTRYLEIGVHQGHSLRHGLATPAELVVSVDPAPDLHFPMPYGARIHAVTGDQFLPAMSILRSDVDASTSDS
jgi:hypothetical protein